MVTKEGEQEAAAAEADDGDDEEVRGVISTSERV